MKERFILTIEFKPFRRERNKYSGLYTPTGQRTKRGRVEIDSNDPPEVQLDSLGHELAHFVWDIKFKGPENEDLEEAFSQACGADLKRRWRQAMQGKLGKKD